MPRIALALALAAIFAGSMQAQESSAPEVVLEGEAGQTMALPDISTFGGAFPIGSTFPHYSAVGRLAKGQMITRHVIASTGCAIKMVFTLIGEKNSSKVQKVIARGVSDVSKKFTAKFDGFLYITIYKQVTGTCSIFVDDTFAS